MSGFITLLVLYLLIGTGIAIYAGRIKEKEAGGQENYFIGGGKISWVVTAMTYAATTYSSFMMVGLVGLSFTTGVGALIFEMTYLLGTVILLSIYGKKIWRMSRENNFVSPMELFSSRYGRAAGVSGALICTIALVPYTAAQVIGLSIIFQHFGVTYGAGVAIAAVLICVWSLIGGLRGVALTDAVQGLFMLIIAIIAVIWAGNHFGGIETSTFPNKVWTLIFFINITLPWAFFALTNPQVVQRLFIVKDEGGIKKMIILFAVVGAVYTLITCFIGFYAKFGAEAGIFTPPTGRDSVIVGLFSVMGKGLAIAVALSIIFASISTSNSIILTLSSMITRDVTGNRQNVWYGRVFIVIITALVAVFALRRTSYIVELSVSTSRILMCFLPLFFDIFHFKKGGKVTGPLTIIGGAVMAVVFGTMGLPLSSVWTLAAAVVFYLVGITVDRKSLLS